MGVDGSTQPTLAALGGPGSIYPQFFLGSKIDIPTYFVMYWRGQAGQNATEASLSPVEMHSLGMDGDVAAGTSCTSVRGTLSTTNLVAA